jgi:formylglycine-generating enzyme required for sulfatase activity
MNAELLSVLRQIITENGIEALDDIELTGSVLAGNAPARARRECDALMLCLMADYHKELGGADEAARNSVKKSIAGRLRDNEGLDEALCAAAVDLLDAALFGNKPEGDTKAESGIPETSAAPAEITARTPPRKPRQDRKRQTFFAIPDAWKKLPAAALFTVALAVSALALIWYYQKTAKDFPPSPSPKTIVDKIDKIPEGPDPEPEPNNGVQESNTAPPPPLPSPLPPTPPSPPPPPAGMVLIQGGTFMMGSPASEPGRGDDEARHSVTLSSFYMGRYEVTQREWREIMGNAPSHFRGDDLPVEQVSWYDAVEYCNKRSEREGLIPAYTESGGRRIWNRSANGYRLPTEAEWEYACRAGTTTPFHTGDNITTDQANYDGNHPYNKRAGGTFRNKTTPVGSFTPNAWELYDMHGNAGEWCWDLYGNYPRETQTDPAGVSSGATRVYRGGCWKNWGDELRSAYREKDFPNNRHENRGFRLARSVF